MKGFRRHPARVLLRLCWLGGEIALALLDFVINVVFTPKVPLARARALWLQQTCRRMLRVLGVEVKTRGPIPLRGLLVSNHLSYLDALVISSITPAVFVSGIEVKRWPVFGWFAVLSGTLFVRRARRSEVTRLNREVTQVLDAGGLVVLFPESAGADGRQPLPFRSSLFEPISGVKHPLTLACIRYALGDGSVTRDICHSGGTGFLRHLSNLLARSRIEAGISFSQPASGFSSRKKLARELHQHVLQMGDAEEAREPALV